MGPTGAPPGEALGRRSQLCPWETVPRGNETRVTELTVETQDNALIPRHGLWSPTWGSALSPTCWVASPLLQAGF